ncbi:hypothetical protein ACWIGW_40035 [Nocardia brasiliensis]
MAITVGVFGVVGALIAVLIPIAVNWTKDSGPGYTIRVFTNPADAQFGRNYITGLDYLFPEGTLAAVSGAPENDCADAWEWAHKNGGVDVGITVAAFIIAAQSKTVIVNTGRIVIDRVVPMPTAADLLSCPEGGPITDQILEIDLDDRKAELRGNADPADPTSKAQAYPFSLLVEPGKADRIYMSASTSKSYLEWHLELVMDVAGKPVTRRIDNNGKSFVTAPHQGAKSTTYIWSDGKIKRSF